MLIVIDDSKSGGTPVPRSKDSRTVGGFKIGVRVIVEGNKQRERDG